MIPAVKSTVRLWRRRVQRLVRANPALKRARRKTPSRWRRHHHWTALRWAVPLGILWAAFAELPADRMVGGILLWTCCVFFTRATHLAGLLHNPQLLWIPYHWAISDADLFANQRRQFLRASVWIGIDWLAFYAGYALKGTSLVAWCASLATGATQFAVVLALVLAAVRWWPRLPYGGGSLGCWFLLIVGLQLPDKTGAGSLVWSVLAALHVITPFGWAHACGQAAFAGDLLAWLGLLVLAGGAGWLARRILRSLEADFSLSRVFGYDSVEDAATDIPTADTAGETSPEPADVAIATPMSLPDPVLRDNAREHFDQLASTPPGRHLNQIAAGERWIGTMLSLRQRCLVDFLRPGSPLGYTRGWLIALATLLFCRLLEWAGLDPMWTGLISILVVLAMATPLFGGHWPGLSAIHEQLFRTGLHACFPVGFGETAQLMLKINALRIAAASPLIFLVMKSGFEPQPLSWPAATYFSFGLIAACLALQPLWIIGAFSKTTNDSSARWWFTVLIGVVLTGGMFGVFVIGAAVAATGEWTPLLIGIGVVLLCTHALLLLYGWAWRRGVFDLMASTAR